jgi:Family of unknown function (DUF5691)
VSLWEEMVSTALVGTERRPLPEGLAGAGGPGAADDPEAVLLDRAAVEVARRRAGHAAGRAEPPPPAAGERAPRAGAAAGRRLARLLAGDRDRLLPEWLTAAAARGLRVPEELLPELLERGHVDRSLRPAIAAVAGARGRWLARLNRDWDYLLGEGGDLVRAAGEDRQVWELGGPAERRGWLVGLRARDPGAAREALAATWASETPADRLAFLQVLDDGLGAADEPFLEAALGDRRREVREAAAELLARLPGSELQRRAARRGRACLRRQHGRLRDRLVAEPPAELDKETERDGVRRRAPVGSGQRAWWLEQLLARTPLQTWIGWLGETPAEIVGLQRDEWGEVVEAAWTQAAIAQRDAGWARALLARGASAGLLVALPPAERAGQAAARLRASRRLETEVMNLLVELPGPWAGELAEAVLEKIARARDDGNLIALCHVAGERLAPELYPRVRSLRPEHQGVALLAATLRFRHDMLKELK